MLLECVQHRATRMVPGLAKLSYEERLKKLGIPSLSYRRFRGDMIEVYKYLHGLYCIGCSDILPLHRNEWAVTRGHNLKRGHYTVRQELTSLDSEWWMPGTPCLRTLSLQARWTVSRDVLTDCIRDWAAVKFGMRTCGCWQRRNDPATKQKHSDLFCWRSVHRHFVY